MENIDRIRQLAGLNEAWKLASGTRPEDHGDRDFTDRLPHDSPDNGYFPPEKLENGIVKQRHKKWPQYDLYSKDGGQTYQGNWTSYSRDTGAQSLPNTKNNGWMATMDLVDADETTGGLLMPPDLVDTAGMRSKSQGLGYSNSPSMQAKRAMQFAQQMGLKDWQPSQGFDVVANYIPYALHVSPGERFKNSGPDKSVRVPVNLFSAAERADIAKARWSGSVSPSISIGGYSLFHPGTPQYGVGREDEEDADIVLGQPRKTPGTGAAGGVHAADAGTKTPVEKIKALPFDKKVQDMQREILAKDPNALPKFHDDGKLGPETAAAMAKYPDIARKYQSSAMATGKTIGGVFQQLGKDLQKDLGKEGDNTATLGEAAYDYELARIKSLSSLK